MNRRSFFGAVGAALIARPTLEDIERLTWKRKYWAGWSPLANWAELLTPGDIITIAGRFAVNPRTREVTDQLQRFVITGRTRGRVDLFPFTDYKLSDVRPLLLGETVASATITS